MGWIIAPLVVLAVVVGVAVIPACLRFQYDHTGFILLFLVGPFQFPIYPEKKKKTTEKKSNTKDKKKRKDGIKSFLGGDIKEFLPLAQTIWSLLGDLRRKIYITKLKMVLTIGDPDPYDLSVKYGYGWAALGNVLPVMEQIFTIRKRDLQIIPDYTADKITVYAAGDVRISLWRLLYLILHYGPKAFKQYSDIKNSKKVVQKNESESS